MVGIKTDATKIARTPATVRGTMNRVPLDGTGGTCAAAKPTPDDLDRSYKV